MRLQQIIQKAAAANKIVKRVNQLSFIQSFIISLLFIIMFAEIPQAHALERPVFYRGIYLSNTTSLSQKKITHFITMAQKYGINAFVMDIQKNNRRRRGHRAKKINSMVPKKIIAQVKKAGIWPIARLVVFDQGFHHYPVDQRIIKARLDLAEQAAKAGFPEIQFDYIRFEDSGRLRHVTLKQRYAVVEGFLAQAKNRLRPYKTITAADIYGRVPLNRNDIIGQRMEGLAKVVDVISPMAYPSHYWTKKLMANPYHTVYITSKKGHDRIKGQAEIVTWIQGFKYRYTYANMSFVRYIMEQIRAVEKANVRGYLIWNAAQNYGPVWRAMKLYYRK